MTVSSFFADTQELRQTAESYRVASSHLDGLAGSLAFTNVFDVSLGDWLSVENDLLVGSFRLKALAGELWLAAAHLELVAAAYEASQHLTLPLFNPFVDFLVRLFPTPASQIPRKGTNDESPAASETNPSPVVLTQLDPQGPRELLGKKVRTDDGIMTVGEHIKSIGCLMTNMTMLLQSSGVATNVAKLYAANYEKQSGQSFDRQPEPIDMFVKKDDQHNVNYAFLTYAAIPVIAPGFTVDSYKLEPNSSNALAHTLEAHSPLIVHVTSSTNPGDGHWIVVDRRNQDGTFVVRDPASRSTVPRSAQISDSSIPTGYTLHGDGLVLFLSRTSSSQR